METFINFVVAFFEVFFVLLIIIFPVYILEKLERINSKNINTLTDLKNLKFYEIVGLADSRISSRDILAILAYYTIHKQKLTDDVEENIYKKFIQNNDFILQIENAFPSPLYQRTRSIGDFAAISLTNNLHLKDLSILIYKKLVADKFYKYNPVYVEQFFTLAIIVMILAFVPIATVAVSTKDMNPVIFMFIAIIVCAYGIFFNYLFAQNLKKIYEIRNKILGFKRYLESTDFPTIQKDEEKFREYVPYFLVLGIHEGYLNTMIKYCFDGLNDRN